MRRCLRKAGYGVHSSNSEKKMGWTDRWLSPVCLSEWVTARGTTLTLERDPRHPGCFFIKIKGNLHKVCIDESSVLIDEEVVALNNP